MLIGCTSAASSVCQDIANCEALGSDQESACEAAASELSDEAHDGGCGAAYDAYFGCASNAYFCSGDTPQFPGCSNARTSLDGCLETERASNACGALQTVLASCARPGSGGVGDAGGVPAPCGASEVCEASCYLSDVANPCAPQPAELSAVQACGAGCP